PSPTPSPQPAADSPSPKIPSSISLPPSPSDALVNAPPPSSPLRHRNHLRLNLCRLTTRLQFLL
ncbi:hypothetical protein GBA52_014882, partial [Prunus armeniaca]